MLTLQDIVEAVLEAAAAIGDQSHAELDDKARLEILRLRQTLFAADVNPVLFG